MTDHLEFNYSCPRCSDVYLPFSKEQTDCPMCGETATCPDAPSLQMIVDTARQNLNESAAFAVISVADAYVSNAMSIMLIVESKFGVPTCEERLEQICSGIISHMDVSGIEHQRVHHEAFVKAVVREAYSYYFSNRNN